MKEVYNLNKKVGNSYLQRDSFVQLSRSEVTNELMKHPPAFMLLTLIALRARRTDRFNIDNLKQGEAMIGDYSSIGLTEQQYRTAKKKLEKWGFATFQSTSKGTIARLPNTDIYNINIHGANEKTNRQATNTKQPDNVHVTTNNNVNKVNNDNNVIKEDSSDIIDFYNSIIDFFPKNTQPDSQKKKNAWLTDIGYFIEKSVYSLQEVQRIVEYFRKDEFWSGNFLSFLKLRKRNKDGVMYIDVFAEQLKRKKTDHKINKNKRNYKLNDVNRLKFN